MFPAFTRSGPEESASCPYSNRYRPRIYERSRTSYNGLRVRYFRPHDGHEEKHKSCESVSVDLSAGRKHDFMPNQKKDFQVQTQGENQ
jgi:hypothetical protein